LPNHQGFSPDSPKAALLPDLIAPVPNCSGFPQNRRVQKELEKRTTPSEMCCMRKLFRTDPTLCAEQTVCSRNVGQDRNLRSGQISLKWPLPVKASQRSPKACTRVLQVHRWTSARIYRQEDRFPFQGGQILGGQKTTSYSKDRPGQFHV